MPPAVDGLLYFAGGDGNVYALDATTGQERWRYKARDPSTSSVIFDGSKLYFLSGKETKQNVLYALDGQNGTMRWTFHTDGGMLNVPTVVNGEVYLTVNEKLEDCNDPHCEPSKKATGQLNVLDAGTGLVKWNLDLGGIGGSVCGVKDETICLIVSTATDSQGLFPESHIVLVDNGAKQEKRRYTPENAQLGGLTMADGVLYIGDPDGNLYAMEIK